MDSHCFLSESYKSSDQCIACLVNLFYLFIMHVLHVFPLMFQLYEEFAVPFDLAESQLAIVKCGGLNDPALIESLWHKIIDKGTQFIMSF